MAMDVASQVDAVQLYRWMALSRALDAALCKENPRWFPAEGEEATIVGSFCDLRPSDAVAVHYRDPFVVYAMRGAELWRLAAQVLGKAVGYSRGRAVPFTGPVELGVVPWVAGDLGTSLGIATGAALAFQQEGSDRVCVCTFGDGTANRGDFHENLNLAACWKLPAVYVCQHNGWAISQRAETYLRAPVVARAAGYGIPGVAVDGGDVEAVRAAVGAAVERARRGEGPTLIEARTHRARGHWAGDSAAYRGATEPPTGVEQADPLRLFAHRLIERGLATPESLQDVEDAVAAEVAGCIERARAAPDAGPAELGLQEVYAGPSEGNADQTGAQALADSLSPRPVRLKAAPFGVIAAATAMRRMTQTEAIIEAIAAEMRRDERVFLIGQDIGPFGGAMQGTKGLYEEFGGRRVLEAPISESAMVGAALGAALFGHRPIVEISFGEFLPAAMSQLINQAPNLHYMTGGVARVPAVIRTRVGDGPYRGHPQDYSGWFAGVPGLKVVMPATPADAGGLMTAAIRDDNPVLFFEAMSLAHGPRDAAPVGAHVVQMGTARVARGGRDVTVVACGSAVPLALQAAAALSAEGIEVEVIDLRSLAPWDRRTVLDSVRRTRRLVTAHEAWVTGGFGAELVATVAEQAPGALAAPIVRVGAVAVPIPSGPLRRHALPTASTIAAAVRRVMGREPGE
jgi:pyruvate/2-oxoglutarate/acetoin dehydrogenase E1 component/TPP-dependent pyruvate/acetoin dehydrogenase alpha subunit